MTGKFNNNVGVVFVVDNSTGLPFRCVMYSNGFETSKAKQKILTGRHDFSKVMSILRKLNYNVSVLRTEIDINEWEIKRTKFIEAAKNLAENLETQQK